MGSQISNFMLCGLAGKIQISVSAPWIRMKAYQHNSRRSPSGPVVLRACREQFIGGSEGAAHQGEGVVEVRSY